jgi:hypothetical protein
MLVRNIATLEQIHMKREDGLLPKMPVFESEKDAEEFDENFSLRILFKPCEGVLWGFNQFSVDKDFFYHNSHLGESFNNFSLLHNS